MPDNYHNAFEEACDLVDAGCGDAEALALAADRYGLPPAERERLAREFKILGSQAGDGARRAAYDDAQAGMRWWNALSRAERARWAQPSAKVADARRAYLKSLNA